MDALPAWAPSVPSEQVSLSSKNTCTDQRANLSSAVLEALQHQAILEFSYYKQDWLNFTSHLVAGVDYNISGTVSRNAIDELMGAGKLDKLAQLLANENQYSPVYVSLDHARLYIWLLIDSACLRLCEAIMKCFKVCQISTSISFSLLHGNTTPLKWSWNTIPGAQSP